MGNAQAEPTQRQNRVTATQDAAPTPVRRQSSWVALIRGGGLFVIFGLLTAIFGLLTLIVLKANLQPTVWDRAITQTIQELPYVPVGAILVAVSFPGFAPWNWIIVGAITLFMLWRRWYPEAAFTLMAGFGGILAEIVKPLVHRPRPTADIVHVIGALQTPSFPSGHTTGYACLYGFLLYLAYTLLPKNALRIGLITLFGLLIVLVGPSRVYMGQHWASDTMGGYALGFAFLLIVISLYRWWMKRHPKAAEKPAPG